MEYKKLKGTKIGKINKLIYRSGNNEKYYVHNLKVYELVFHVETGYEGIHKL